jgi:peptidoglycan/LPS O-acetylase OafA/YrhL
MRGKVLRWLTLPVLSALCVVFLAVTVFAQTDIEERTRKKSDRTPVQELLIGLLILALIGLVPGLGGLILSAINLVGFGAVLTRLLNKPHPQPN